VNDSLIWTRASLPEIQKRVLPPFGRRLPMV
jgi:hypothetical protein